MGFAYLEKLKKIASNYYKVDDPSHDWGHIIRVLCYAEQIHSKEGGDWEIIATAVLFHDCLNFPKDDPRSSQSAQLSAKEAERVLKDTKEFPQDKIHTVMTCIEEHSYSRGITPEILESKIVQDADRLESTGIISLIRTFSSGGIMKRQFFHSADPFCGERIPNPGIYSLDLAPARLLQVSKKMNTATAKEIAAQSDQRIHQFMEMLGEEITLLSGSSHFGSMNSI